jgi:hypothetical protein
MRLRSRRQAQRFRGERLGILRGRARGVVVARHGEDLPPAAT